MLQCFTFKNSYDIMLRYALVVFVCILGVQSSLVTLVSSTGKENEGLLSININGTRGTVCDDKFDSVAAGVVCAQLGYSRTNATVVPSGHFGYGSGTILLDEVHCRGNETDLLQCSTKPVGVSNCIHSEDVGIICQEDCRSNRMDIVFLLDSSSSEGSANFRMQIDFVLNLVRGFEIGPNNVQVAVVIFSTAAHVYAYLNQYNTKSSLLTAIQHIQYTVGNTYTHTALQLVRTHVFGVHGDRTNAQNILIVLTDGKSRSHELTLQEADLLRLDNVKTYAVGIGQSVDKTEIDGMAFTPHYAYNLAGFSSLIPFASSLGGQLCDVKAMEIACGNYKCDTRYQKNTCLLSISFASSPPHIRNGECVTNCVQHLLFSNRYYPECHGRNSSTTCCCRSQACIDAIVTNPTTTTLPTTTAMHTTQAHRYLRCGSSTCDTYGHYRMCLLHITRGLWHTYPSCVVVNSYYPTCTGNHTVSPCSCTTQTCIDSLIAANYNAAHGNTTTARPTTTASTTTSSLSPTTDYNAVHGNTTTTRPTTTASTTTSSLSPTTEEPCKDHDPYNYCSDTTATTCNPTDERGWLFARKVCAKTCGFCIRQLSHVCEDNDHNNYCRDAKDIICQLTDPEHHDFAVQACAQTCGLCDEYNELYGGTYEWNITTASNGQGTKTSLAGAMIG